MKQQKIPTGSSRNADVVALGEMLGALEPGALVTYREMADHLDRDPAKLRTRDRWIIYGAIKIAEDEHSVTFDNERGVGYRCLKQGEVPKSVKRNISKIRRRARKEKRRARCVTNYDELSPDERAMHNANVVQLLAIEGQASAPTHKRLMGDMKEQERVWQLSPMDAMRRALGG